MVHTPPIEITDVQLWSITLACILMLADVLVGFIVAIINNELSSVKMRKGILHKVLMLILIFICLLIEIAISHAVQIPYDIPTCEVACGYIAVMELMSVLENIAKGYPYFSNSKLFKLLDLKNKDNEDKEE